MLYEYAMCYPISKNLVAAVFLMLLLFRVDDVLHVHDVCGHERWARTMHLYKKCTEMRGIVPSSIVPCCCRLFNVVANRVM